MNKELFDNFNSKEYIYSFYFNNYNKKYTIIQCLYFIKTFHVFIIVCYICLFLYCCNFYL